MTTREKPPLRRPPHVTKEAENFIAGAEERVEAPQQQQAAAVDDRKEVTPKAKPKARQKTAYPWEESRVRADVTKVYNLRLPEPTHLQLKWLAERSPESMHEIAVKAVVAEVERRLRRATQQVQEG